MQKIRIAMLVAALGLAGCGNRPAGELASLTLVTSYLCGDLPAEIGMADDRMILRVDGEDHVLTQVASASGARYAVDGASPETGFWSKSGKGLLTLRGEAYPECEQRGGEGEPAPEAPANWTARGQEPGWLLSLKDGVADFTFDYGAQTYSGLLPLPRTVEGGIAYSEGPGGLAITSLAKVCEDAATGLPYPDTVTVAFSGEVYEGCGGDPQALLTGADWLVEEINGTAKVEDARVSLAFDAAESRISGRSGCNAYSADYSVGGEGIGFGPVMSTEMACSEPLMMQERRLYDALALVDAYRFDETGALVLTGPEGTRLVARR